MAKASERLIRANELLRILTKRSYELLEQDPTKNRYLIVQRVEEPTPRNVIHEFDNFPAAKKI